MIPGEINEENAPEILNHLANDVHRDFNPADLETTELTLESELMPELNSDFIGHPARAENCLNTHKIPYDYLFSITDGFTNEIGRGGFAEVFKGITHRRQIELAIKKLKKFSTQENRNEMSRQLNYEVDQYDRLKHKNIIELLGYSNDKEDELCLIYPYMCNGTLKYQLEKSKVLKLPVGQSLSATKYLEIMKGAC